MYVEHSGAIVWYDQPTDFNVSVGGTALFKCNYTGTPGIPWWRINGRSYSIRGLPDSRHYYHDYVLTVRDVTVSDNSSTYQCFFGSGVFSTTGRLFCYYEVETGII